MLRARYIAIVTVCALATFLSSGAALARDRSFAAVLRGLKQDYQVEPQQVPGMWLAKCCVKLAPKDGVSGLDFVLFEGRDLRRLTSARDFDKRVRTLLGPGWRPFVQVDSAEDKERVLILARPDGRRMDLFILSCEPDEGVAMFLRVNPKALKDVLDDPCSVVIGN